MNEPQDYEFFTVHQIADVYHAQSTMALIESYANTEEKAAEVSASAQTVAKALWEFLDGIYDTYCQDIQSEPVAVLN